jgi:ribosomal protein L37AE/L43A
MSIIQPLLSPVQENGQTIQKHWWQQNKVDDACQSAILKPGDACPSCIVGTLDYDGLFLLTCDTCGKVAEGGAFT